MENLKELEISEMIKISGGSQAAYDLGYALGTAIRQFLLVGSIVRYLI
jgi:hypothetical protein